MLISNDRRAGGPSYLISAEKDEGNLLLPMMNTIFKIYLDWKDMCSKKLRMNVVDYYFICCFVLF